MNLSNLPKIVERAKKRVGRGYGSGKGGHTSGRGQKGQKSRDQVPLAFEGTKTKKSLLKRLPLLRGKGRLKPWGHKPVTIKLSQLTDWPAKMEVTAENLMKRGITPEGSKRVKILGDGEVKTALLVRTEVSRGAAIKITKAGGKIQA